MPHSLEDGLGSIAVGSNKDWLSPLSKSGRHKRATRHETLYKPRITATLMAACHQNPQDTWACGGFSLPLLSQVLAGPTQKVRLRLGHTPSQESNIPVHPTECRGHGVPASRWLMDKLLLTSLGSFKLELNFTINFFKISEKYLVLTWQFYSSLVLSQLFVYWLIWLLPLGFFPKEIQIFKRRR